MVRVCVLIAAGVLTIEQVVTILCLMLLGISLGHNVALKDEKDLLLDCGPVCFACFFVGIASG